MGLDIYAGTLTRYYTGAWETVVQRAAREAGYEVQVVRPGDGRERLDAAVVRQRVLDWRDALSAGLAPHLPEGLDWSEDDSQPYFTDKPAWDCFGALVLWAAYDDHPELTRPTRVTLDSWREDPAYLRSSAEGSRSRYPGLLRGSELWLPGEFGFTFVAEDVSGSPLGMASVGTLQQELEQLNRRLFHASDPVLETWRREGADEDAPAEVKARFGLAVCLPLVRAAGAWRLPLKLDY